MNSTMGEKNMFLVNGGGGMVEVGWYGDGGMVMVVVW